MANLTRQAQVGQQVRNLRTGLGLSLRVLAAQSGFSPSFISQVENGQISPSIASLERIAAALGVTIGAFFAQDNANSEAVVRALGRQELSSSWSRAKIEALGPVGGSSRQEPVMITISPGGRSGSKPSGHPGEEFALVFEGEVTLTLAEDKYDLKRGDSVSFLSETPHLWENNGQDAARVVIVSPRFTH